MPPSKEFLILYFRNLATFTAILGSLALFVLFVFWLIPIIQAGGAGAYLLLIVVGYLFFLLLPTMQDWQRRHPCR